MRLPGRSASFLLLAAAASAPSVVAADNQHDPAVANLLEWFTAQEGVIFNAKQQVRALDQSDTSSVTGFGVFATTRIEEGETLFSLPWDMILRDDGEGGDDDDSSDDEETVDDDNVSCGTIRKLIDELKSVRDSGTSRTDMEPYMRFLLSQLEEKREQIPSAWSDAGKELFRDVLGGEDKQGFPPENSLGWSSWLENCKLGEDPDGFKKTVGMLAVQRNDDGGIVPVADFYNHRNGPYLNTMEENDDGEKYVVSASRIIEEGEQIHTSYNNCSTCELAFETYGTPEIFRETGVMEPLPQRWMFESRSFGFDLEEKPDGSGEVEVTWHENERTGEIVNITHMGIAFLRNNILRLERLQKLEENNEEIPEHERKRIWQYSDALVAAMKHALKSRLDTSGEDASSSCLGLDEESVDGTCVVSDGYDALDDEEDDLYWDEERQQNLKPLTCVSDLNFPGYTTREEVESTYQEFTYVENNETDDMCFDIDHIVQICVDYRPHYHEINMDFPARYVDDVKRVVFVGGGDSMLLYETLKYPNLELVIGLELDQMVVRKSFKYFHTQPHFEDDRVEWWFGDATKSLLMLPNDYFGSFDMVLVDLSETVMSFAVTNELDVFDTLALLLNKGGVMIKNESHLEKMSTVFDYTAQIYLPDLPTICDQIVIMGSNKADFFTHTPKGHDVKTLLLDDLLEPLDPVEDRFYLFHDYRKNDARAQGKCDISEKPADEVNDTDDEERRHAGILMIVDAEDTTVPLQPLAKIEGALTKALEKEGLTLLNTITPFAQDDGVVAVIVMEEGYVMARVFPDHKYCALDIHLWGAFNKVKSVRDALVAAVGSRTASMSSFRIVVGGMLGTSTWSEDQKSIGPRNIQMRNCDEVTKDVGYISDEESIDIALEETLTLLPDDGAVAVVLCGVGGKPCKANEVLRKKLATSRRIITLTTCPDIADGEYSHDVTSRMISCERDTIAALNKELEENEKIDSFTVDASVPLPMVKIANSIWSSRRNIEHLAPRVLFAAVMLDESETWRKKHNFIDKTRRNLEFDPISSAEIVLSSKDGKMEIGVLRSGDADFFPHLDAVTKNIAKRSSLDVDVRKVQGGMIRTQDQYKPRLYKRADYNNQPAIEQFSSQKSLGRQTVFQLDMDGVGDILSCSSVNGVLRDVVSDMKYSPIASKAHCDVGKGSLAVSIFSEGSAMVVWDGDKHIDINLFTYDEDVEKATKFLNLFKGRIPGMKMSLRDNMPRGIGRVVSFSEEK